MAVVLDDGQRSISKSIMSIVYLYFCVLFGKSHEKEYY